MRVVVRGRVQGVGFRYSTVLEASNLGLTGWVRNRSDGSVEVWFEGRDDAVAEMLDWLARGPGFARVTSREAAEQPPVGFHRFTVEQDA